MIGCYACYDNHIEDDIFHISSIVIVSNVQCLTLNVRGEGYFNIVYNVQCLTLNVRGEGYFRNASFALIWISMLYYQNRCSRQYHRQ